MKKLFIFMFVLASILFSIILFQDKYGCAGENRDGCLMDQIENGEVTDEEICGEFADLEESDICYFTLAQKKGAYGIELCSRLSAERSQNKIFSRDYCYYNLALSEKDQSMCLLLSSKEQKNLCSKSLALTGKS